MYRQIRPFMEKTEAFPQNAQEGKGKLDMVSGDVAEKELETFYGRMSGKKDEDDLRRRIRERTGNILWEDVWKEG